MREPDILPLYDEYYCYKDWGSEEPILKCNGENAVDSRVKSYLTVLLFNDWARCRTPSFPILLALRSSVVSVYVEKYSGEDAVDNKATWSYCIVL